MDQAHPRVLCEYKQGSEWEEPTTKANLFYWPGDGVKVKANELEEEMFSERVGSVLSKLQYMAAHTTYSLWQHDSAPIPLNSCFQNPKPPYSISLPGSVP